MTTWKINNIVELPDGNIGRVDTIGCGTIWVESDGSLKSYRPNELKKPKTVRAFNGNVVSIKAMQKSLRVDFPSYARKDIDDNGTPFLQDCVMTLPKCGCKIEGNGTLQFPLRIKFCNKHK